MLAMGFQRRNPVTTINTVPHTSDQYSIFSSKVKRPCWGLVSRNPRLRAIV